MEESENLYELHIGVQSDNSDSESVISTGSSIFDSLKPIPYTQEEINRNSVVINAGNVVNSVTHMSTENLSVTAGTKAMIPITEVLSALTEIDCCKICNIQFKSKYHASSHYECSRHLESVSKWIEKNDTMKKLTVQHGFCKICNENLNKTDSEEKHLSGSKHKLNIEAYCDVCQTSLVTKQKLREHLKTFEHLSAKYGTNKGDLYPTNPAWPIYVQSLFLLSGCKLCNVHLNQKIARSHYESCGHIRKLMKLIDSQGLSKTSLNMVNSVQRTASTSVKFDSTQKEVKAVPTIKKKGNLFPTNPEWPVNLQLLMLKNRCKLCGVEFGEKNASSHYKGLKHGTKLKEYFDQHPLAKAPSKPDSPENTNAMVVQTNIKSSSENSLALEYCYACECNFDKNSDHLQSLKHLQMRKFMIAMANLDLPIKTNIRRKFAIKISSTNVCQLCSCTIPLSDQYQNHIEGNKHKKSLFNWISSVADDSEDQFQLSPSWCYCKVCNTELSGTTLTEGHYSSQLHQTNVRGYCSTYNVEVNTVLHYLNYAGNSLQEDTNKGETSPSVSNSTSSRTSDTYWNAGQDSSQKVKDALVVTKNIEEGFNEKSINHQELKIKPRYNKLVERLQKTETIVAKSSNADNNSLMKDFSDFFNGNEKIYLETNGDSTRDQVLLELKKLFYTIYVSEKLTSDIALSFLKKCNKELEDLKVKHAKGTKNSDNIDKVELKETSGTSKNFNCQTEAIIDQITSGNESSNKTEELIITRSALTETGKDFSIPPFSKGFKNENKLSRIEETPNTENCNNLETFSNTENLPICSGNQSKTDVSVEYLNDGKETKDEHEIKDEFSNEAERDVESELAKLLFSSLYSNDLSYEVVLDCLQTFNKELDLFLQDGDASKLLKLDKVAENQDSKTESVNLTLPGKKRKKKKKFKGLEFLTASDISSKSETEYVAISAKIESKPEAAVIDNINVSDITDISSSTKSDIESSDICTANSSEIDSKTELKQTVADNANILDMSDNSLPTINQTKPREYAADSAKTELQTAVTDDAKKLDISEMFIPEKSEILSFNSDVCYKLQVAAPVHSEESVVSTNYSRLDFTSDSVNSETTDVYYSSTLDSLDLPFQYKNKQNDEPCCIT